MSDAWLSVPFSELPHAKGNGINPSDFPDEEFELYSVPAHETGKPEIVTGKEIGSNKQIVTEGTVLLCKINPRINRTWIVKPASGRRQIASTEWIAFDQIESINPMYLMHFMRQAEFHDFVASNASGVGGSLMRIKPATLADYLFRVPGTKTQEVIVAKLEELLSDLDASVAELKAAQKKLAQYRQSLLKAAVEGALTAEWRDAQGRANVAGGRTPEAIARNTPKESGAQLLERILRERRQRWEEKQLAKFKEQGKTPPKGWQDKYPAPVQPDTTGLPQLPEEWVWASLDMLSEIQGGIQKQPSRTPVSNKYPFLRVANVARGQLKLDEIHEIELFDGELERLALQKGDILIVEGNGSLTEIGRCALWDGSIENAVHQNHLIRSRPVLMRSEFVEAWLNSLRGIEKLTKLAATTSGLYTLSVGKISKIPVPVPPLEEQSTAVAILVTALDEQRRQLLAIELGLKQSAAQRKNILKAAFSGQLVPQDPIDEPASVLLERIRAERAAAPKAQRGRRKGAA